MFDSGAPLIILTFFIEVFGGEERGGQVAEGRKDGQWVSNVTKGREGKNRAGRGGKGKGREG